VTRRARRSRAVYQRKAQQEGEIMSVGIIPV
jgi:hypothetical protein